MAWTFDANKAESEASIERAASGAAAGVERDGPRAPGPEQAAFEVAGTRWALVPATRSSTVFALTVAGFYAELRASGARFPVCPVLCGSDTFESEADVPSFRVFPRSSHGIDGDLLFFCPARP
jgi:hypothetical protein